MSDTLGHRSVNAALDRARAHSPFLATALLREPVLAEQFGAGDWPGVAAAAAGVPNAPLGRRLRLWRRRLALIVAIGDLAGLLDLDGVTAALTAFADEALDLAIGDAIRDQGSDIEPCGMAAIALGKQGSRELNYSSDIDPILIYDPATLPRRAREEPEEAAVRIARRVVETLQARDGDGYVLRVDLRLRPSPEVTPIALPINAALTYYESQALPWERAAFIRARPAAGDVALGERFLSAVRPFVWRRALDFGALGELRAISRRIRDHHAQGQQLGEGYDLKRGRGGIREVEFFTQIHQLIHGGRDPALREPATRPALAALAAAALVDRDTADALAGAYALLRTIEHRAQMVDDRQTHALPRGAALDNLARLDGMADGAALIRRLRPHVERVGQVYDSLEPDAPIRMPRDDALLVETLADAGFGDAAAAARRIEEWRGGGYRTMRSPAAREALEAALPSLVQALGAAPDPDDAILRLDGLLDRLPSAINLFRLLEARPPLARLLTEILCHAPPLAAMLGRRAELLDGLIDASALEPAGTVTELVATMRQTEAGDDYEAALGRVRALVGEKRFALGAQIVAGATDPLDVAQGYARLAEAAVEVLARATIADFSQAHGEVPGSELVVVALGRFGGGALTHASDLDLIYVFTGDHTATSDGARPLGAVHYYNRLAQRVSAALSVQTASGALYEVDTRLRPSGEDGPLAVSLDGFARYQREEAWTWEHMALTRARPVFGSPTAREAVRDVIGSILSGDRPERDVVADARAMRREIAEHKPPQGPIDAKLLPGGLVDLEFAVHTTQLARRTGFDPDLGRAVTRLSGEGIVPSSLNDAHDFLTRLLVTLRLLAPDAQPPAGQTRALIARAVGVADWEAMIARLDATRQEIRQAWAQMLESNP